MGEAATTDALAASAGLSMSPKKYKEIVELGRGGMATVYLTVLAGPGGFNKLQVVKRLRPALAADPEFLNMFVEEARLSARINHPNVVQTNEVGFDGTNYFIAMEYLDGESLDHVITRAKKRNVEFPLALHLMVLSEVLAGLHYAHELKDFDGTPLQVVHRDVSPHNVSVTYEGSVKVLDFGIAKAADSSNETRTGVIKGKCAYMALEQFGGKDIDRRADIFAVGIMLWQALTGQRMYPKSMGDAEIMMTLAEGKVTPPRQINPAVTEEMQAICLRALAKDRDQRFATAAEFQAAIDACVSAQMPPMTRRDLGTFVADLFSDKRERLRGLIEDQIKRVRENPHAAPVSPTSLPATSAGTGSESWGGPTPSTGSQSVEAAVPVATDTVVSPTNAPPRRIPTLPLVAGAVAVLAIGGLAFWRLRGDSPRVTTTATASEVSAEPPKALGKIVELTVRATPASAKLFLDDTPLPSTPVAMPFARDGITHQLRAEASGYETQRQVVVFDSNTVSAEFILVPVAAAAANPNPAKPGLAIVKPDPKATVASASPVASSKPAVGEPTLADPTTIRPRPPRTIEQDDPWAPKK